jgi:hypothetical protein
MGGAASAAPAGPPGSRQGEDQAAAKGEFGHVRPPAMLASCGAGAVS